MKRYSKRMFALFLALVLAMSMVPAVFAETKTQDGISVEIKTDKEDYAVGEEAEITVVVKNANTEAVSNLKVEIEVPQGITLKKGFESVITIAELSAGTSYEAVLEGDVKETPNTGDSAQIALFVLMAAACAATVIFAKKKNGKAMNVCAVILLLSAIGAATPAVVSAADISGDFIVEKKIKIAGKETVIKAKVSYGTANVSEDTGSNSGTGDNSGTEGNQGTANSMVAGPYKRVSVHDPSIVKDPKTGTYYIFGSHMAWAKSNDLMNWTSFTNNINREYRTMFAAEAAWAAKASSSYDVSGNLWAPDVIWNETMQKWCMYMSINGPLWNSTISLLTADSLDGDWTYVGPVIQSGMSNGFGVTFDYTKVTGETTVAGRYALRNNNPTYEPHAIDPGVTYDEEGNLWMSYGSWSGGIGMIQLDKETGLRDYDVKYELDAATLTDPYTGYKIAGGNQASGEASYIEKIGDYYYLFMSYGGLVANGGYSMRIFRSEDVNGPYVDASGDYARYKLNGNVIGSAGAGNTNGNVGIKLMTYYKWSYQQYAQVAQGHNSAFVDEDGKAYVVYHTRTNDGTEGHSVRVHQLFVNADGWIVAAPFEYCGETLNKTPYTTEAIVGSYEVLLHEQSINYSNLEYVAGKEMILNADGTVSGDYTGTWVQEADSPNLTVTVGGVDYKGVLVEQYQEGTQNITLCFTLLGSNEKMMWGSKNNQTGKDAIDAYLESGKFVMPTGALTDIEFITEGLYGTTMSYESADPAVLTNDGKVTRGVHSKDVVVKVTFKNGDYSETKEYTVKVIGTGTPGESVLVGEFYTGEKVDISKAKEGTFQFANPFNKEVTKGLEIYNGASIEFDVEGTGTALSNILAFDGGGKLYFTGGSYLGYNATGGYFDANLKNYGLVTDYINGKAHIEIKLTQTGFEVYANDVLAYSNETLAGTDVMAGDLTGYPLVLAWLNNNAATLNFGWGNWWGDVFQGTISNVKLYANYVAPVDTSGYVYYEDFSDSDVSAWNSTTTVSVANDGTDRGSYLYIAAESGVSGNRGSYTVFGDEAKLTGKYTISVDAALTAGTNAQRSVSGFSILGTDAASYTGNDIVASGYILKLRNVPPAGEKANQDIRDDQTKWYINDMDTYIDIPVGEWINITAEVDTDAKEALVTIAGADGTELYKDTVAINGSGELMGLQVLRGRGIGTMSVDSIRVTK